MWEPAGWVAGERSKGKRIGEAGEGGDRVRTIIARVEEEEERIQNDGSG